MIQNQITNAENRIKNLENEIASSAKPKAILARMKPDRLFQLSAFAKNIPFDVKGHFHGCEPKSIQSQLDVFSLCMDSKRKHIQTIISAIKTGENPKNPIPLGSSILITCPECGESPTFYYENGKFVADPCVYPNGMPAFTFELNVPSGKFVVENDLRDAFPLIGDFDINHTEGQRKTSLQYAKIGLAHGFVGNTCPAFQAIGDDTFYITNGRPIKGAKTRCHICTDLWWYSICDLDELKRRLPVLPKDLHTVKCKPGVYEFTHSYHTIRKERGKQVYASLTWVRPPDPVTDLQAKTKALNLTAGQIIAAAIRRWGKDKTPKHLDIKRKADLIINGIGNGYAFHPNGWLGADPDVEQGSPSIKIPRFQGKQRWYPLCNYSAIVRGAGLGDKGAYQFNKSFAQLAFNIVACMLTHGVEVMAPPNTGAKIKKAQENHQIRWAWHIYLGLKTRYQNWIPSYAKALPKPKIKGINIPPN